MHNAKLFPRLMSLGIRTDSFLTEEHKIINCLSVQCVCLFFLDIQTNRHIPLAGYRIRTNIVCLYSVSVCFLDIQTNRHFLLAGYRKKNKIVVSFQLLVLS